MTKRKLRNCSQCGVRHGPPFGKFCTRVQDSFDELNREMSGAGAVSAAAQGGAEKSEVSALLGKGPEPDRNLDYEKEDSVSGDEDTAAHETAMFASFEEADGAFAAPWLPAMDRQSRREPATAELPVDEPARRVKGARSENNPHIEKEDVDRRLDRLENVLGKMCGVYQATMERFADLTSVPKAQPVPPTVVVPPPPPAAATPPPVRAEPAVRKSDWDPVDLESVSGDAWMDYHGREMWKAAEERKKKNPFSHVAYLKKGDKIECFESLIVVTFKTIQQLLDAKYDVSGVVKHGLMMAEKASKNVFELSAFLLYDESVRDRAGETGPTAFGQVDQEDSLRFFSADNMKKSTPKTKAGVSGQGKKRSDKLCIRFNNGGCTSKSCFFAHRCVACDDTSHGKKDCKAKKKEGK